jgi:hypothetical protein
MNTDERSLIEGLFERLQQAEAQSGPRDPEAENLIQGLMARQPAAPYLLAQVVLVQEQGLRNLQGRVEELERELAERPQGGSGFLGGLFGGRPQSASEQAAPSRVQPTSRSGWSNGRFPAQGATSMQPGMQPGAQGGGFMAGALQTAMGVAGGVLLGNALGGLFAGDAQAAETPAEPPAAAPDEPESFAGEGEDEGGLFDGFFGGGDEEGF